jgi:predicted ATPase
MTHLVFISHSSKDKSVADVICSALEANDLPCWIAPRDIVPGTDWSAAIVGALEECPAVVVILSENSNASEQVRREVQRSFERKKIVIPIRIDDVVPTASMEYYLAPVHWLNAPGGAVDGQLPALIDGLKRQLYPADGGASGPTTVVAESPSSPLATEERAGSGERSGVRALGNLPTSTAPYIGRKDELAAWENLLASGSARVLTLVGFGGMGKTRSALELAYRTQSDYPDGAWWVPLEEAQTADEALRRIASALHVDVQPQERPADRLGAFLKSRKLLLVLDNLEQIPDADVAVHTLVVGSDHARFLVTTRKALEIASEQVVEVSPLPDAEAQALFEDRARARQATFQIDETNRADVAEICRRLEGMPLAIELAAARIVGMMPREILERLTDWNKVLQTRAPHLPPRQRAIQGAIEWSHELLTDEDKDLFAQLSVFANGFTLSAAESICDAFDVFEGVHELRRHSFLRAQPLASTQQMRFFMLELVRSYASDHLSDDDVRRRHAEFFLKFAEERNARLRTAREQEALQELDLEMGNLREALNTARKIGNDELFAKLTLAMARPLSYLGGWREAKTCLQEGAAAAERLSIHPSPERGTSESGRGADGEGLIPRLLLDLAGITLDMGDIEEAASIATRAHECSGGDRTLAARALNLQGLAALGVRDEHSARAYFDQALKLWGDTDPAGRAIAHHNLALLASRAGDLDGARSLYQECLKERQASGDVRGEAETLGNLGALEFRAGDHEEARRVNLQSLDLRKSLRDRLGIALTLYNLGELAEVSGDQTTAIGLYAHADLIFCDLGSAYAAASREALDALRVKVGDDVFEQTRSSAVAKSWESILG